MKRSGKLLILGLLLVQGIAFSQDVEQDMGVFKESNSEFREKMNKSAEEFKNPEKEPNLHFIMDLTGYDLPDNPYEFTSIWHNKPVSQGITGTCWAYSSTSFFESEIYRISGKQIKLSEMYTVYWETVEKARRFVQERGDSHFSQGSMANATIRIWKKYGVVPYEAYTGLKSGQEYNDHNQLWDEMHTYLEHIKTINNWNEEQVISTIKSILNHHLGIPPTSFDIDNKTYTPHKYLDKFVKIDVDDYISILSLMENDYLDLVEYKVPDNWWHSADYFNVELDIFIKSLNSAIEGGYTVGIGGDVSEAGINEHEEIALIPSFDIPSQFIDDNARQFRFSNRSTTDDHVIHLVGYQKRDDGIWYLIKDSGSGGHTGPNPGYYFYHEDYIKLKMMYYFVHKDAVNGLFN